MEEAIRIAVVKQPNCILNEHTNNNNPHLQVIPKLYDYFPHFCLFGCQCESKLFVTDIDQNNFYVSQQKESHTGLEWREDE